MRMLVKPLFFRNVLPLRCFSSSVPNMLKIGDILRQTRIFSNEDVCQYSKVTCDVNPLHFDKESARNAGFEDRLVHGMLVASLFPRIISSHFVQVVNLRENKKRYMAKFSTKCFKNGEILVLSGEATAILPTLTMELVRSEFK
ncbi:hypothetical protein SLEP1_g7199 [Rubroshorea leprosula]|uniref:MaoC-like domain-containing protein n=1 Tax=Rubroshorea leprosula TaxID=152421 RepID=A0AAV5HXL8_9ROSI|nr:hypothetical protein SLEP1_g7199 [Rubroshorea leprosula]